jgi:hypothetical protein
VISLAIKKYDFLLQMKINESKSRIELFFMVVGFPNNNTILIHQTMIFSVEKANEVKGFSYYLIWYGKKTLIFISVIKNFSYYFLVS